MSAPTATERIRQTGRLLRSEGVAGVARRLLDRAANHLPAPAYPSIAIAREDLLRVAEITRSGSLQAWSLPADHDGPLTVAWVCFAPSEGSGGHTTMFRMVSALEQAGHRCIVYLRDDHGWSIDQHRRTIRSGWPAVQAEIRDLADGIEDADAIFATAWQTAYAVLASRAAGARLYFVQDFEPAFYAAGSEALLAEATYRFGFHGITAGAWLAQRLRREYGMPAAHFRFGCDLDAYGLDSTADDARDGICYYCRPAAPRRAHELAVMALDLFAARHPEVPIHVYGERPKSLPFAFTEHGLLSPPQLNRLYNRCVGGLVLSATNVSLVPHEMLAAGCLPIVNDAEHNRIVLDNPAVVYAGATPFELADALCMVVEQSATERARRAKRAADSVQACSWHDSGEAVESIVRQVVRHGGTVDVSVAA